MHVLRGASLQRCLLLLVLAATLPGGISQQRQSTRRPTPRKCTLTVDEVDSLTALLEDIEQEPTDLQSEETESEEEPEEGQVTQCTRELARLRNSIRRLQETYQKLKDNIATVDVREYQIRRNRYDQQKLDLTAKLSGLESQVNTKHRSQITQLKRKIQEVEKQLNASISALERQRQENVQHYINLVASKVNAGDDYGASRNFKHLMTYSTDPYGEIVKRVSSSRNMLQFLMQVNFEHQPVAGYEALVDKLIKQDRLNGAIAVDLMKHIQALILARDGRQQERAVALLYKFKINAS